MTTDTDNTQGNQNESDLVKDAEPAEPSAAERLKMKHEAEENHRAKVEDTVDEEDILHPPPSAKLADDASPSSDSSTASSAAQPAEGPKPGSEPKSTMVPERTKDKLDTTSHEAFPELGAGQPSRKSHPVSTAWGTKKSSPVPSATNGVPSRPNGQSIHGKAPASSNQSSRASTPASGMLTPDSNPALTIPPAHPQSLRSPLPQSMAIPGRYSERITLFPQEIKPSNQLKKPVSDVLRDINRKSKANVQMSAGAGGARHFDAKGPVDAVRQALKEVAKELGSKQSIRVAVPASVRPHIIGRQGATVQAISQRTGAQIQIPKQESSSAAEDDDSMIDVLIQGDSVAAEMARREIENIANERTSNVNLRLKEIPAEFYPFIAGPNNSRIAALEEGKDLRIQVPHYHIWSDQPPPQPRSIDEVPAFVPARDNPILVSGDRVAAQAARAAIEGQVEELRRQLRLSQLDIQRGQHQFVLGERGTSLHDFLAETGCAVILPPASHDSETVTIIGPPERLEFGVNKVEDLASSVQMNRVDISRQHPNAPLGSAAHARNLTRYLRERKAIERLEDMFNAHVSLPVSEQGPVSWEIFSREGKNTIRARTEIMNIVNAHPPSRLDYVDIEPFYHTHLREQHSQSVKDDYGVHLVFPETDESPQILLVCEGPKGKNSDYEVPKGHPSAAEAQEFAKTLEEAKRHLLGLVDLDKEIVSRDIPVPKMFNDKLQKRIDQIQKEDPGNGPPVRVFIGAEGSVARQRAMAHNDASGESKGNIASLRGPAENVDALARQIQQFILEEQENERERGFTLQFDFPQKFSNYLIGKKGENIRKYRDEFDVEIQVHDGKVEIKGPRAKAEAAKARIVSLGKKLEDETTHILKVHPQYHRELIGNKGSQVNRLQERYNVRINFPRTATDNNSVPDTASEAGARRPSRPSQESDEVVIKGPRKSADDAREELLSLLQWTMDHSHTGSVSVAQNQIPSLIGQGGRGMDELRVTTGAQIDVPDVKRDSQNSSRVTIKLKGTKKQVDDAKRLLEERAKAFDETVMRSIEVDKKYHKALIGSGGSNIRDIVLKAGGPDDRRELARMVRFPRPESNENTIRVEGKKEVVEKIVASIEETVKQKENEIVDTVEVAPEKHGLLIGRGGEIRRNLESQFHVTIDIPRQAENGPTRSVVKITGQREDIDKAKTRILAMTKHEEGETVLVPRRLHHAIADNGQFFRRLRSQHNINVDHGGHRPPPKPEHANPRSGAKGSHLPLITDDDSGDSNNYSWHVHDVNEGSTEEGDIPWVLRGSPESIARAQGMLKAALEQAQKDSTTGYLILPDPSTYRFVVGQGGAQVNSIRNKTGCRITVPRDRAKGEAIEIQGTKDSVEEAKDIILDLVRQGGAGGGRRGGN